MSTAVIKPAPKSVADYAGRSTAAFLAMLKSRGVGTVTRYINGTAAHWKVLTIAERDLIWSHGMNIWLVWETSAARPLGGAAAGRQDGRLAAADVKRLGYPSECILWVAFDINVDASNRSVCVAYWHAFKAAYRAELPAGAWPLGDYGDWDMIDALPDADGHWQPNARFWSSVWHLGRWRYRGVHPKAHLLQYLTIDDYDPNDALRPGLKAWAKPTAPQPPNPTPEDDEMKTLPTPVRVLDTRQTHSKPIPAGQTVDIDILANVVGVNITVVDPAGNGYLQAWGANPRPDTSNVNFTRGETVANFAQVALEDGSGKLRLRATAACHMVVDLQAAG